MAWRFNPAPGWPVPPSGWTPPEGWVPDPSWPAAPPGWQFWIEEPGTGAPVGVPPVQPMGPAPAPRRGGCLRALLVLAFVILGVGLVGGVISALVWAGRSTETRDLTSEAPTGAVRIEHSCGPITLREGRPGVVTTRATIRYLWRMPTVTSTLDGDVVLVKVDCPAVAFASSVSLVVDVPPDGSVNAHTSAGSVTAAGVSSELTLSSSAGSVTAREVTSTRVTAESSAGSVSLSWAAGADPTSIAASSSAGSVTVTVPDVPGVAYNVDAGSSAGSTRVDVRTDPQSDRTITARSSAGSVLVGYR